MVGSELNCTPGERGGGGESYNKAVQVLEGIEMDRTKEVKALESA